MAKYGRLISLIAQLCLNHGIHLGVCDTLYKKKKKPAASVDGPVQAAAVEAQNVENVEEEDEQELDEQEFDEEVDNEEEDEDWCDQGDGQIIDEEFGEPEEQDYMALLGHVRKLVVFFRRSPVRNTVLQGKVREALGKKRQLALELGTP